MAKPDARWQLSLRSGIGPAYLNRLFDPETNPDNTFFSAPVSFLLYTSPTLSYQLGAQWGLSAAFNYHHISNGGQRQPNRGMNYPMWGLGLRYFPSGHPTWERHQAVDAPRTWLWAVETGLTNRSVPDQDRRGLTAGLAVGATRRINNLQSLGFGLEFIQDEAFRARLRRKVAVL
ncbi:acyloxyacyl hydrolase [Nitritalea halalkaliphila]|uniref:acyloxyacyl hydrolase n=1 Tax=Nitritalea halalkaliphila TaxID=590849 RepID=UPI000A000C81|nr:acyloxyacyl hydrolase [Nitritalea halalkaliphila]